MVVEKELTLNDYLAILRRRALYIAGIFLLVLLATVAIAIKTPSVYQSTGTILIESQKIPPGLVQATVETYAAERIEVLKQRVMTRDTLYEIVKKYHLFNVDNKSLTKSELVARMRKKLGIVLVDADLGDYTAKTTIAFQISFEYHKPEIAYQVAKEMVDLFLEANEKARKEKATETTEFLSQEADRQGKILGKIEQEVANYKQKHSGALPQNMELQMASLERAEADLRDVRRNYAATEAEIRNLELELESAKAGIGLGLPQGDQNPATELEKLKTEYAKLSGIYKENHPSLRTLQRKIETLEKSEQSVTSESKPATTVRSVMVAKVQGQIEAAKARLASLTHEEGSLRAKLTRVEGQVVQTPQVEGALATLMRDYENAKNRYEEIKAKQVNAKMTENLELENKGERFALVEAPVLPEKPISPDRPKILLVGFFIAIASAIVIVMLMEGLDKRVRGVEALSALLQIRPLVLVPYISNQSELRRRKNFSRNMFIGIVGLVLIIWLIAHLFVTPLDILLSKN